MRCLKGFSRLLLLAAFTMVFVWPAADAFAQAKEVAIGYSGILSGVAAEYGQDCANGIEMAVNDLNAAGGITVGGQKYVFKLVKLDDQANPTSAVNNSRRLRDQNKVPAIFNAVSTTIFPMAKINEEKGNEFLIMAYTSTPKVMELGNKLLVASPPPFTVYVQGFADLALSKGWKKCAMVVTLGVYGDEWRHAFKEYWISKGGELTADKPANYYTETDFSAPLTAAMATKPDVLLIGGPSAPTALVIEQARGLGYKGAFILIDQAKMDYIENILKSTKLMTNLIGTSAVADSPTEAAPAFVKRYKEIYKRMATWEVILNYNAMNALSKAMIAAGSVSDVYKIRAAFPKAFPLPGNKFPSEWVGITEHGRMYCPGSLQMIDASGKYRPADLLAWWCKNEQEFNKLKTDYPPLGNSKWIYYKWDGLQ